MINEQTFLLKTTDLVPVGGTAAVACNAICPETSQHQHQRIRRTSCCTMILDTDLDCKLNTDSRHLDEKMNLFNSLLALV